MNTKVNYKSKKRNLRAGRKNEEFQNSKQNQSKGKQIVYQIQKTILHFFPDLYDRLNEFSDHRKRKHYEVIELLMGGIVMFLFKEGSRNAMNNDRKEDKFSKNYLRLFKLHLPHMDAVDDLMSILKENELEGLKAAMVTALIENHVFRRFKFLGKSYNITIDGTGIASYDKRHCSACQTKTSKTGKVTYFHNVIEAKLVTSSGFSISLATEWASNEGKQEYDKQDCELKAFVRIAEKIKHFFPRLPVLITADGLYPNQTFFKICAKNNWDFIVTLQDKSLKTLQEEICSLKNIVGKGIRIFRAGKNHQTTCEYHYLNELEYKGIIVSWVECIETTLNIKSGITTVMRFAHLTNLEVNNETTVKVSDEGRLRWKIENEGFNTQKNEGYGLGHKFSRKNFNAMKNYYQCLQIAHIINQLAIKSKDINEILNRDKKFTIRKLWERLRSFFVEIDLVKSELIAHKTRKIQIRLI